MDERITKGAGNEPLTFPLVLTSDHKTAAVGVTPSLVRISKNGGAFAAPAGAVSPVGNGWYQVAGNAADADTVGPLLLHAEAPGCDPLDVRFEVVLTATGEPLPHGSTTYPMTFLLIRSADHLTGAAAVAPAVTIAKPGGAFAAPAGTVAEIGYGWYRVGPAAADYDVAGPLILHATATGCDPADDRFDVAPGADSAPAACGTDVMANGMAWLTDQLQRYASEPVVYQRGSEQVALCATFGSTLLKLDDGAGGIRMERTDRDFLIPAASLVLSGSKVLPKVDDEVIHNDGTSLHTFRVLPYADEPHWRWSDPFRKMLRIHTKRISSEPL